MERNIATIRFLITILYLQLKQITIQEDHNIHMYSLFCLVALAVKNSRKPLLLVKYRNQVFKEQKRKKKEKRKVPHIFL